MAELKQKKTLTMIRPNPKHRFEPKRLQVGVEEIKRFNWLSLTTLISTAVPILYVIGRSHFIYYLDTYGLSSEFFPRDTQDYLFFALMAIWSVIYHWLVNWNWFTPILYAGATSLALALALWFEQSKLRPWLKEKGRNLIDSRSARVVGVISFGPIYVSVLAAMVGFLLFFLAIPIAVGLNSGQQVAHDEIQQDRGKCKYVSAAGSVTCTVVFKNGVEIARGRVIAASDVIVAIAVDGNVLMLERSGLELRNQSRK